MEERYIKESLLNAIKLKLREHFNIMPDTKTLIKSLEFSYFVLQKRRNIPIKFLKESIYKLSTSTEKEIKYISLLMKRVLTIFDAETELTNLFTLCSTLIKYLLAIHFPEDLLKQILFLKWEKEIFVNSADFIKFLYLLVKKLKSNPNGLETNFVSFSSLLYKLLSPRHKEIDKLTEEQKQLILKLIVKEKGNIQIAIKLIEKGVVFTTRALKFISQLDLHPSETMFLTNWVKKFFIEKYFDDFKFTKKDIDRYFTFLQGFVSYTLEKSFFLFKINFHKANFKRIRKSKVEKFEKFIVKPDGSFCLFPSNARKETINFFKDKWRELNDYEYREKIKKEVIKNIFSNNKEETINMEDILLNLLKRYYNGDKRVKNYILKIGEIEGIKNIKRKFTENLPLSAPEILHIFYHLYSTEIPSLIYTVMNKGMGFIKKKHLERIELIKDPVLRNLLSKIIEESRTIIELKREYNGILIDTQNESEYNFRDLKILKWLKRDIPEAENFTKGILEKFSTDFLIAGIDGGESWIITPSKGIIDIFKGYASRDCTRGLQGKYHLFNPDFVNFRIFYKSKWIGNIYVLDKLTPKKEKYLIIDAIQVPMNIFSKKNKYKKYIKGILNYFSDFGRRNNYKLVLISEFISNSFYIKNIIHEMDLQRITLSKKDIIFNEYDIEFASFLDLENDYGEAPFYVVGSFSLFD